MPVKIPQDLPARMLLEEENIFVMTNERAMQQEIRPLKIAVLNLMPNKIDTETQLLRLIGNTPLQVEVVFLTTKTYVAKHTPPEHLTSFYKTFDDIKKSNEKFDGLIITGAPVEKMDFLEVAYWGELQEIMEWAEHNVYSTMYICWAALAGLYYHYNIDKHLVDKKIFGVFKHKVFNRTIPLVRGFDDEFYAPHSRYTNVDINEIRQEEDLIVLAYSDEAGAYLLCSKDLRRVFVLGHGEYDSTTLFTEYMRDVSKGIDLDIPKNYFPDDDVTKTPKLSWRAHESLLISNWLNYCVYQATPYDIKNIK